MQLKLKAISVSILILTGNILQAQTKEQVPKGYSQQEFFRSKQVFATEQLTSFYSSVRVEKDMVFFLANDYKLYAYDKENGKEKWSADLKYKTNTPLAFDDTNIYAGFYDGKWEWTGRFDIRTGKMIKQLPVGPLGSVPLIKDGVLFGTGLYEGGCLFAYDIKKDTVLWWRFLAHGFSTQPYFFADRIQANAEANNWAMINYKGQLTDTSCKEKADIFVSDIPCIKKFIALTHDGFEINEQFSIKNFGDESLTPEDVLRGEKQSFALYNDKLVVIKNKGKIASSFNPSSLLPDTIAGREDGLCRLIAANEQTVSFVYYDNLFVYDHQKKKLVKLVELAAWQPHQVVIDNEKLWIISKKDGLLYGLAY
ncbi:MAG TPA: PQQ-binding-like beta-propeller repeat protein [Chitinophagaceae bacterium]